MKTLLMMMENLLKRMVINNEIKRYFDTVLSGYRSETDISDELIDQLPLFIDMVLIENIVDEFECCHRENAEPDMEDIADEMECLVHNIHFAGFFQQT